MPKYLAPIDLQQNELRNARLHVLPAPPANPVEGQTYYNSTLHCEFFYNGTTWVEKDGRTAIPEGPATGDLDGTYPAPVVRSGAITDDKVAANAGIKLSKLAVDPLARANHTGTQIAATISDFDQQVRTSRLDQLAKPTGSLDVNAQRIINLADPSQPQDAATKAYVDASVQGLDVKQSVRVATTANVTLSGLQTIDGVTLVAGDAVLVMSQTAPADNGIYIVASGAWARRNDANTSAKVNPGAFVFVEEGNANHDNGFVLTTDGAINLGTTALNWVQFSGAGQLDAGTGLTKSGNQINANGTPNRIAVSADAIDIATTYVGQTSITTVGDITSGTWDGTTIAVARGGTGGTTPLQARTNLGATTKYTQTLQGGATSEVINHGLNTPDLAVTVRTTASPFEVVYPDIEFTSVNTVTVRMANVIPATTYSITLIG